MVVEEHGSHRSPARYPQDSHKECEMHHDAGRR